MLTAIAHSAVAVPALLLCGVLAAYHRPWWALLVALGFVVGLALLAVPDAQAGVLGQPRLYPHGDGALVRTLACGVLLVAAAGLPVLASLPERPTSAPAA